MLVLGIIDAGDGSRDVKLLAGNLTDHEIVLVFSSHRDNDVSTWSASCCLCPSLRAVAAYRDCAKDLVDLHDAVGVALDEQHFVPFGQEVLGKVVTDLAASGDDDVHD